MEEHRLGLIDKYRQNLMNNSTQFYTVNSGSIDPI